MKRNNYRIFVKEIKEHLYRYYFKELGLNDWKNRTIERINEVPRNKRILKTIEHFTGSLKRKNVLVVGSGWGGVCVAARELDVNEVVGIDIDNKVNSIANIRMTLEGYMECCFTGAAEYLPFKDNYFDYVHCFTVLEHVQNIHMSLLEMIRVVKKDGYIFIQAPNYLRPIERHYKISYIPLMPKKIARIYLKLMKKPNEFIDSINYVWPGKIKRMLSNVNNIEINEIVNGYKYYYNRYDPTIKKHENFKSFLLKTWDFVFRTNEIYFLIRKK
jgi:ubiquinone/menaquinone biosynthesis C-methylase UbiE